MLRRCLAGIQGITPDARIHYYPDPHRIAHSAAQQSALHTKPLAMRIRADASDSTRAADALQFTNVVISLGGDGTNRAIAKGIGSVPLIALSTGTNNAFPEMAEATVAGVAASYIARGNLPISQIAPKTKVIHVRLHNKDPDLALVDLVGTTDRFTGARAITDPECFSYAVVSIADPSKVGMTGIAGMTRRVSEKDDFGLALSFAEQTESEHGSRIRGVVAPGVVKDITKPHAQVLPIDQVREWQGASMLAFDGEREIALHDDEIVFVWIARDGPRRVNIEKTLHLGSACDSLASVHIPEDTQHAY